MHICAIVWSVECEKSLPGVWFHPDASVFHYIRSLQMPGTKVCAPANLQVPRRNLPSKYVSVNTAFICNVPHYIREETCTGDLVATRGFRTTSKSMSVNFRIYSEVLPRRREGTRRLWFDDQLERPSDCHARSSAAVHSETGQECFDSTMARHTSRIPN